MPAGYASMTDPKTAGNLKTDEDSDNAPDSAESELGDEASKKMCGKDLIQAINGGDPMDVYNAFEHCKRVCDAAKDAGGYGGADGAKSPLVVAIGKAKPRTGG